MLPATSNRTNLGSDFVGNSFADINKYNVKIKE